MVQKYEIKDISYDFSTDKKFRDESNLISFDSMNIVKDKPSFYTPRALAIEDQLKEEQDEEIENELRLLAQAILKANQVLRAYEEKKQIKL